MQRIDLNAIQSAWHLNATTDLADPRIEPLLNFTDRASYLSWVQEWKEHYRMLSAQIRDEKAQLRQPHDESTWQVQRARLQSRRLASALLVLRRAGKARSWEMKQANSQEAA